MNDQSFLDRLVTWLSTAPLEGVGVHVTLGALVVALFVFVAAAILAWRIARPQRRGDASAAETSPASALRYLAAAAVLLCGGVAAAVTLGVDLQRALNDSIFSVGNRTVTAASILAALAALVVSYAVSRMAAAWLARSAIGGSSQVKANAATLGRLAHYLVMIVGIAVALGHLGVELNALFAVGGVAMIALGFGLQTITQNFVSGVILMIERSVKHDDILEVEGRVVRVLQLGIRTTIVRTRDGEELIVPNSVIAQGAVKNYTYRDSTYRLRVSVGVSYGSDVRVVFATLQRAVVGLSWVIADPPPQVLLTAFGNNSVEFEVNAWMDDPWAARGCKSELHDAIWWALKEEDVTIAFPQLDLHLDPAVTAALAADRGTAG